MSKLVKALRRIYKYHHFPAIEYQYRDAEIGSLSPTLRWIGEIVLQIVTTLSSAYAVFNAIICRLIIHEIKVLFLILTLRRPNLLGFHVPVSPDLAKTVKVRSDHSENLTEVFGGAKNGNFS